ncbi:MAG TPA: hypothetical protein VHT34_08640 [Clostridia bacterium]|nr:hypothetical protein [Clostridia bacterium]
MKLKKIAPADLLLFILLIPFAVIFTSCTKENAEDDGSRFYEGNYTDEIAFKTPSGSVNIVVEQIPLAPRLKENIPYSVIAASTDSTRLKLFVSYGNYYAEKPKVFLDVSRINDTVFIWYTNREKTFKRLQKTNSINSPEDIPKPAYIRIDSIAVFSASNVNLLTKTLR